MTDVNNLARQFAAEVERRGLTFKAAAREIGVRKMTAYDWRHGRRLPRVGRTAAALRRWLGDKATEVIVVEVDRVVRVPDEVESCKERVRELRRLLDLATSDLLKAEAKRRRT